MTVRLEEDHPSIVVLGGFDPGLLHPQWFRSEKLLGRAEADSAAIKVIAPEVAEWSTEAFVVQATRERLLAQATVESAADAIHDLVLGTLQVLSHIKIAAIGLNRSMHFDVGGERNWHRIGDRLAPKELWKGHLTKRPGLLNLQIEESSRADGLPGKIQVRVQPSGKYTHAVFFDVNSEIRSTDEENTVAYYSEIIRLHWQRTLNEARSMGESVLEEAMK